MEAIPQTFLKEPVFRNLERVARYAALSKDDKESYKASLKTYRDAYATEQASRRQGKEEGLAEGRAEGLAEGIEKGIEKERRESYRNMISFGMSPAVIAEKYGITEEDEYRIAELN